MIDFWLGQRLRDKDEREDGDEDDGDDSGDGDDNDWKKYSKRIQNFAEYDFEVRFLKFPNRLKSVFKFLNIFHCLLLIWICRSLQNLCWTYCVNWESSWKDWALMKISSALMRSQENAKISWDFWLLKNFSGCGICKQPMVESTWISWNLVKWVGERTFFTILSTS